jgi:hypothetical protein
LNSERKKYLKNAEKNSREKPYEKYCFFVADNEAEVQKIASNGFTYKESSEPQQNLLGPSSMGFHFNKHLDVLLQNQYQKKNQTVYCMIVKLVLTKLHLTIPTPNNKNNEPKSDHDHLTSQICPQSNQDIHELYANSLIYTYQYDKMTKDIVKKPDNILPYALLSYKCENPNKFNKRIVKP